MPSSRLLYIAENIFKLPRQDRVVGSFLYDKYNEASARVDGLVVESQTFLTRYLIINFGGFLKIGGKKITLPVKVCEFADLGTVKTEWTKESMKDAPAPNDIEDTTTDEEELILSYFDLQPNWPVHPPDPRDKSSNPET